MSEEEISTGSSSSLPKFKQKLGAGGCIRSTSMQLGILRNVRGEVLVLGEEVREAQEYADRTIDFLDSLIGQVEEKGYLTEKQREAVDEIWGKVTRWNDGRR